MAEAGEDAEDFGEGATLEAEDEELLSSLPTR